MPCGARRESTRKATWLVQELFITLHSPLATRSSERSTPNALVLFNSRSTLASSKNVLPNKPQLSRSSAKMVPIFPSLSLDQTGFNIEDFVGLLNRVLFRSLWPVSMPSAAIPATVKSFIPAGDETPSSTEEMINSYLLYQSCQFQIPENARKCQKGDSVDVWSMTTWGTRVEKAQKVSGYKKNYIISIYQSAVCSGVYWTYPHFPSNDWVVTHCQSNRHASFSFSLVPIVAHMTSTRNEVPLGFF